MASFNDKEMADSDTTLVILNRYCSNLQSEDRKKRKQALEGLYCELFEKNTFQDPNDLGDIFNDIQKNIWKCLYDQSEVVRDTVINIMEELVERLKPNEKFLSEIIPIMLWRLGEKEVNEPSEEVRLRLISLLNKIILKFKDFCSPYMEDIVQILSKSLVDGYPKIRQESCICAGNLGETIPRSFYEHAKNLIKPILSSFNHQHFRMRVASIQALGKVVRWGNTKHLPVQEVFGSLAERLFDSNAAVRSAVTKVIGDWLLNLYDRYSFFSKMIPLILTSLCDELPELRQEAWDIWSKAGEQYVQENEQELKEKMDFLSEKPDHYPKNVERPNLGCRTLVQRNTCQITPALSRELEDWKNDIRIKSAQLLCWLVLHAETDITQHTENLLLTMYKVCSTQTDERIIHNVEKAAEYIAYFVPPETYMQLIVPIIQDICHVGHLCVLAALIRGTKPAFIGPYLYEIGELLSDDNICRNRNSNYQMQLLKCCNALLMVAEVECSKITSQLFTTIITVKALASSSEVFESAQDVLEQLSEIISSEGVPSLFSEYTESLLKKMDDTVAGWTSVAYDRAILQLILEEGGPVIGLHLRHLSEILKIAMKTDADPHVRSKLFITMSSILARRNLTMSLASLEEYQSFIVSFIQDIICPNLIWHAGRTAEALRTVVVACLCAAVLPRMEVEILLEEEGESLEDDSKEGCGLHLAKVEVVEEVFKSLFPPLVCSVEDSAVKTRLYSVKALDSLINLAAKKDFLTPDHVNIAYPVLLKRLDDVNDQVRLSSASCLKNMYSTLPRSYDPNSFKPHLESLFATMLIHLDDPSEDMQKVMIGAFKAVGKVSPKVLHDKLDVCKDRFRNYKLSSELLEYLKSCYQSNAAG